MGGISIWQLLIIAVIVILLFGTKKLRNVGGDLGSALKSFKKAMNDDDKDADFSKLESKESQSAQSSDEQAKEKQKDNV